MKHHIFKQLGHKIGVLIWLHWLGQTHESEKLNESSNNLWCFNSLKGIGFGVRVEAHIIVSKYWLPSFVFGSGPIQSIITWTGNGFRGADGGFWLGLPTNWHMCRFENIVSPPYSLQANISGPIYSGKFCLPLNIQPLLFYWQDLKHHFGTDVEALFDKLPSTPAMLELQEAAISS